MENVLNRNVSENEKILNDLGLRNVMKKKVRKLSGGQKQRASIARAVLKNCKVLLCDEPTGSLDSKNAMKVVELLSNISKSKLVIVATHADIFDECCITTIMELNSNGLEIVKNGNKNCIVKDDNDLKIKSAFDIAKNFIRRNFKNLLMPIFAATLGITAFLFSFLIDGSVKNFLNEQIELTFNSNCISFMKKDLSSFGKEDLSLDIGESSSLFLPNNFDILNNEIDDYTKVYSNQGLKSGHAPTSEYEIVISQALSNYLDGKDKYITLSVKYQEIVKEINIKIVGVLQVDIPIKSILFMQDGIDKILLNEFNSFNTDYEVGFIYVNSDNKEMILDELNNNELFNFKTITQDLIDKSNDLVSKAAMCLKVLLYSVIIISIFIFAISCFFNIDKQVKYFIQLYKNGYHKYELFIIILIQNIFIQSIASALSLLAIYIIIFYININYYYLIDINRVFEFADKYDFICFFLAIYLTSCLVISIIFHYYTTKKSLQIF